MRTIIAWILALVAFVLLIRYTNILTDNDFVRRRPGSGDVMTGFVGCITPRGDRLLSGQTVTAYANPRVTSVSDCQSQSRSCSIVKKKGVLSGSYQHEACRLYVPPAPVGRSCTTPRGSTVRGGIGIIAYQSAVGVGGVCQAERRLCADGVLKGSYRYPDCNLRLTGPDITRSGYTVNNPVIAEPFVGAKRYPAELIQPKKIETSNLIFDTDGKRVTRLTQPPNQRNNNINNPVTTDRSYLDPIISPSVTPERWISLYPSNIQSGCVAPRGERIIAGGLVQAFAEPYGTRDNICRSEFRICSQSKLDGSYAFASCLQSDLYSEQLREQIRTDEQGEVFYNPTCSTPRRREISDEEQTIAYENRLVTSPAQCVSQVRSCSRGVLDGSYRYSQCLVVPASYSGLVYPDGFNPGEAVFPEIEPYASQYIPDTSQSTAFKRRLDANIEGTKNFPRDVRDRLGDRIRDLYELVN